MRCYVIGLFFGCKSKAASESHTAAAPRLDATTRSRVSTQHGMAPSRRLLERTSSGVSSMIDSRSDLPSAARALIPADGKFGCGGWCLLYDVYYRSLTNWAAGITRVEAFRRTSGTSEQQLLRFGVLRRPGHRLNHCRGYFRVVFLEVQKHARTSTSNLQTPWQYTRLRTQHFTPVSGLHCSL